MRLAFSGFLQISQIFHIAIVGLVAFLAAFSELEEFPHTPLVISC